MPKNSEILIIDDLETNLTILKYILSKQGYQVHAVLTGELALKVVQKKSIDLIILDILMPDMDGFDVCQELKQDPKTRDIPIIFISALDDTQNKLKGFKVGGVDYITKPFQKKEVLARVGTHLLLKQAQKASEEKNILLKTIFSSIADTIVTVDKDLKIIEANTNQNHSCNNNDTSDRLSFQKRLLKSGSPCHHVLTQTLKTKKPIINYRTSCFTTALPNKTVVLNSTPLIDRQNQFCGAVLVIRDITGLAQLEKNHLKISNYKGIISKSKKMRDIFQLMDRISGVEANVLITGESGTGKELVASAIHEGHERSSGPFVKVNCAALSETLLESELFGHVKGAFTGAFKDRIGRFQAAEGGTLFLDEIGDVSLHFQAKLLRVLEQKEYERIGDSKTLKANVRVLAATNRNLEEKIQQKSFREDLLYRLRGISIPLPPLKERDDDIQLLTRHFIDQFSQALHKNILDISDEVKRLIIHYPWPGNIRELKSVIEYACILCTGEIIEKEDLPIDFLSHSQNLHIIKNHSSSNQQSEKEIIVNILNQTDWNKAKAARNLGISRGTLYNKLIRFNIDKIS